MNIHCLFSSISSLNEIRLYKASYFAVYNVYSCSNIYVTRTAEKWGREKNYIKKSCYILLGWININLG